MNTDATTIHGYKFRLSKQGAATVVVAVMMAAALAAALGVAASARAVAVVPSNMKQQNSNMARPHKANRYRVSPIIRTQAAIN